MPLPLLSPKEIFCEPVIIELELLSPIAILSSPEVILPNAVVPTPILFALVAVRVLADSFIIMSAYVSDTNANHPKTARKYLILLSRA